MHVPTVALPSIQSLFVRTMSGSNLLTYGTAFIAKRGEAIYLVTNWHIAAGRSPLDGQPGHGSGATPDRLVVLHSGAQLGTWVEATYDLYDEDGRPRWFEHPEHGRRVDVVALPFRPASELGVYPYPLEAAEPELVHGVSDDVSIIGFPFGRSSHAGIGVWSRGAIASEPELPYNDLPCFLIDSRTRQGQSGSPVIVYSRNGTGERKSETRRSVTFGLGQLIVDLLGVYSGRISVESDLGIVWKRVALLDILVRGRQGNGDLVDPIS